MTDLTRFVEAQESAFATALDELRSGEKRSHWMWFIFPQIAGLGQSPTARKYAIADMFEARAYLSHTTLGVRLSDCTEAMLAWGGKRDAVEILGSIDAMKFASSMTLFEAAGGDVVFAAALDTFFGGTRDTRTLELLHV